MKKRLTAAALALIIGGAAAAGAFLISHRTPDCLVIDAGETEGVFLPFFNGKDGDAAVIQATLSPMKYPEANADFSVSGDVPSAASEVRYFFADKDFSEVTSESDARYTAAEFTLKEGVLFSDGMPMTLDDAVFSLYTLLDPKSEADKSAFSALAGYTDYKYGIRGVSSLAENALEAIANPSGAMLFEDDRDLLDSVLTDSGIKFASGIKDYVVSKYLTDGAASTYIMDGLTKDDVLASDALTNAFAIRMWNYGTFTYKYEADPEGDLVGTLDADGNTVFKATYEAAMEDDSLITYVADAEGDYTVDLMTGKYLAADDDTPETLRYSKELSDKYFRIKRAALTGFRDSEGNGYTLSGNSFPTMTGFFSLMKNAYTSDGVFDYEKMERVEGVDSFSFSAEASLAFALARSSGETVNGIEGVKTEDNGVTAKMTLYFEGKDFGDATRANFYIVSKAYCLDGYDPSGENVNCCGAPVASAAFFDHLRDISSRPVSAGAYTVASFDEGAATLTANGNFTTLGDGVDNALISKVKIGSGLSDAAIILNGDGADLDDYTEHFAPDSSYKYILINPSYYRNINARAAIASTLDINSLTGGKYGAIYSCIPTYYLAGAEKSNFTFDKTGATAAELLLSAGYTVNEDEKLVDPATKSPAVFTFYLLPEEEGGAIERMIRGSIDILRRIGADGEIVFDIELKNHVYSERSLPIYVMGWDLSGGLSLGDRYSYTSGTDASRAGGLVSLYRTGQIDEVGRVTYTGIEGYVKTTDQSDAVEELANVISAAESSINRDEVDGYVKTAKDIVTRLVFEIPLYEYNSVYYVNEDIVDADSMPKKVSCFNGPLSAIWKIDFSS